MRKLLFILALAAILLISGCSTPADVAEEGDNVTVDYVGEFENGTVFDTSIEEVALEEGIHNPARPYEPLGFTLGGEGMIKGFDSAVQGMAVGEEKTVQLSPEQAYGPYKEELIRAVPLDDLPNKTTPYQIGDRLSTAYGQQVVIVDVNDTAAMIDFNHPMAGETMKFNITLVSIEE